MSAQFCQQMDHYVVLRLRLADYSWSERPEPAGVQVVGAEARRRVRQAEKRLLKSCFKLWRRPYHGNLPGWREQSPLYVLWDGRLAGGLYVCADNEFGEPGWGQLHYFFVDPQYRGHGLHALLFHRAIALAGEWGLAGVYVVTDRHGLPEVYQRWGAAWCKRVPKVSTVSPHPNMGPHNWLIYRICEEVLAESLSRYALGVLVDVGCGEKPYAHLTTGLVERHIGVDHADSQHGLGNVDVIASAYDTTLPDGYADTVLCTAVLEHLERPEEAMREMCRVLNPGGHVILTAPLFWHLHEGPRDFYRFTKHGLAYLFDTAGFEIVEIRPLSGFAVTFAQELCYYMGRFAKGAGRWPVLGLQLAIQRLAYALHRWDRSHEFTWMYLAVARKPPPAAVPSGSTQIGQGHRESLA